VVEGEFSHSARGVPWIFGWRAAGLRWKEITTCAMRAQQGTDAAQRHRRRVLTTLVFIPPLLFPSFARPPPPSPFRILRCADPASSYSSQTPCNRPSSPTPPDPPRDPGGGRRGKRCSGLKGDHPVQQHAALCIGHMSGGVVDSTGGLSVCVGNLRVWQVPDLFDLDRKVDRGLLDQLRQVVRRLQ
jgi:hypothetical protein